MAALGIYIGGPHTRCSTKTMKDNMWLSERAINVQFITPFVIP